MFTHSRYHTDVGSHEMCSKRNLCGDHKFQTIWFPFDKGIVKFEFGAWRIINILWVRSGIGFIYTMKTIIYSCFLNRKTGKNCLCY